MKSRAARPAVATHDFCNEHQPTTMHPTINIPLVIAAVLSGLAALMHLGCILGGASWYRVFGAGERMARGAEAGRLYPAVITAAIALVLMTWAAYALSGASVLPPLPLLKPVLCAITLIYLCRGLVVVPMALSPSYRLTPFWIWSSAICLGLGLVHLLGLLQVWPRL